MTETEAARPESPDVVGARDQGMLPTIHLTVVRDGRVRGQYLFAQSSITLGRQAGVDVVLDDVAVSRLHAEISCEDGGYVLHDLGSANGMCIGDARVVSTKLGTGDVVRVPPFAIHVTIGGEPGPGSKSVDPVHDETTRAP